MSDDPRVNGVRATGPGVDAEAREVIPPVLYRLSVTMIAHPQDRPRLADDLGRWLNADPRRWPALLAVTMTMLERSDLEPRDLIEWARLLVDDGDDDG